MLLVEKKVLRNDETQHAFGANCRGGHTVLYRDFLEKAAALRDKRTLNALGYAELLEDMLKVDLRA